jgi:gamma-glutamyltranspeptidase/glutathione hydrolase
MRDGTVTVESSFDDNIARALIRKGHDLRVDLHTSSFGRGQIILRMDNGVLVGGTESRADSNIACY